MERYYDFKLDFEGLEEGHHSSFHREIGVSFGAYDLNVVGLIGSSVDQGDI